MLEYDYLNYMFDAFMYSLQTDINVGIVTDGESILHRVAIGVEVTRDELVQFVRRACSAARRAVNMTSCMTIQEVATSTPTPRPARPIAHSGGSGCARPRATSAPAPWQPGGSGWARGYAPPQPGGSPDLYGQFGGFDTFPRMSPDQGVFPLFRFVIVHIL